MVDGDLSDFGVESNEHIPPLVHRKNAVESPVSKGTPIGFVGRDRRRDLRVYTTRRKEYHYYKSGMGYAISDAVISRVQDTTMSRIIIHVPGKDVYEFGVHQYANGNSVPSGQMLDGSGPKSYVPLGECLNSWPGHASSLFVDSFETAMERVYERSWW